NTGGEYFRALTPGDLPRVFERINEVIDRPPEMEPKPVQEAAVQQPPPPPAPVIIEVPVQPTESVNAEERVRSIIILVAAVVLVVALVAIIMLLIKRNRETRPAAADYVAEAYLNDIHGITGQGVYKLRSKPTMIGRVAGQDTEHLDYVVIPETTIGRRHALIEYKDFAYWIMDQGSINGTFVNDRPVSSEVRLKHGDRVRVHKCEFEFAMPDMGEAGMTVVSQTRFAGQAVPSGDEATVLRGGGQPGADQESVFDITGGVGDAKPAVPEGEESTVMRAGSGKAVQSEKPGTEDETLMPARPNPLRGDQQTESEDETLLPGGRADEPADKESEDETILPLGAANPERGAGAPERGKADDEVSRVPGLGPRRK
ncbi:MAG: FHA domain-containing protein, partial [Gammaproteobacteria bacterium]